MIAEIRARLSKWLHRGESSAESRGHSWGSAQASAMTPAEYYEHAVAEFRKAASA